MSRVRLGCPNGCPLGYHEEPCPLAGVPQPPPGVDAYGEGYRDGYAAGYQAACEELARREPLIVHAERLDLDAALIHQHRPRKDQP